MLITMKFTVLVYAVNRSKFLTDLKMSILVFYNRNILVTLFKTVIEFLDFSLVGYVLSPQRVILVLPSLTEVWLLGSCYD